MTLQLPSSKLRSLIEKIRTEEAESRVNALDQLIDQVEKSAQTDACFRCQNADWGFFWNEKNGSWFLPVLLACRAGATLPATESGFGLEIPAHFYCTLENSSNSNYGQTVTTSSSSSSGGGSSVLSTPEAMAEAINLRRQTVRP